MNVATATGCADPAPIELPPAEPIALPRDRRLRIVGDVHGDSVAFGHALNTDRFIVQLGDLVDHGPDSPGVLSMMFDCIDREAGLFILGNHDRKLGRALAGHKLRSDPALEATLARLEDEPELKARALYEIARAPAWTGAGRTVFVHGAFHTRMLETPPPPGLSRVTSLLSRALFGETSGRMQSDGYPERRLSWVDHIPPGFTVYCGHDRRSTDGRPWVKQGRQGGTAIFVDTGAGKGGHLAWIDLDALDRSARPGVPHAG
jgi:3',5'-cyclic AMP phosphodiesterase CpdA